MASDPSVYNQLGKDVGEPANPLALQAQMYQTANSAMNLQGQVAKRAAGEAFQQSITQDGAPDQAALLRNLAANPQAAMAAQESAQSGQTLSSAEYTQHMARLTHFDSAMAGLRSQYNGAIPLDAIQKVAADAVAQRIMTPDEAKNGVAQFGADPVTNGKTSIVNSIRNLQAQQALSSALPNYTPTNTGGTTFFRDANPVTNPNGMGSTGTGFTNTPAPQILGTGGGSVATSGGKELPGVPRINNSVSAEFAAGQQNEVDADGKPVATSTAARMEKQGMGGLLPPQARGGVPPGLLPPGYNGRYAPTGSNRAPAVASPPAASGVTTTSVPISVVTGLAPGVADSAAIAAKGGAEQGASLQRSADDSPNRQAMLGNMASDLEGFTSGPGASQERQYGALVGRYAPGLAKSFGLDPQTVASSENFAKLAKQIALQQAGTLGAGTDQKLMTTMGANPNDDLSKLGNKQIIGMLQGNEDAIGAKAKAWQAYKQSNGIASDYGQFQNKFNENFDPRFFQAMRMSQPDRQRMFNAIPANEQDAFKAKFRGAVKSGMLSVPTGG